MRKNLTIIKLGGPLLTDKQRPYTLRSSTLEQAAAEVKACLDSGLLEQLKRKQSAQG
jgi:isopentenyl phosphate kinase